MFGPSGRIVGGTPSGYLETARDHLERLFELVPVGELRDQGKEVLARLEEGAQ